MNDLDPIGNEPIRCGWCGDLGWTVKQYGRVTHKESCPYRETPWHQGNDRGNCDRLGHDAQNGACVRCGKVLGWVHAVEAVERQRKAEFICRLHGQAWVRECAGCDRALDAWSFEDLTNAGRVAVLEAALRDIIDTIGPKPAQCCECPGCRMEIVEALRVARHALARPVGRADSVSED